MISDKNFIGSGSSNTTKKQRPESGTAVVEMAFILPVLMVCLFGMISFAYAFNTWQKLEIVCNHAARQWARQPDAGAVDNLSIDCSLISDAQLQRLARLNFGCVLFIAIKTQMQEMGLNPELLRIYEIEGDQWQVIESTVKKLDEQNELVTLTLLYPIRTPLGDFWMRSTATYKRG